jgi:hypothetical protein
LTYTSAVDDHTLQMCSLYVHHLYHLVVTSVLGSEVQYGANGFDAGVVLSCTVWVIPTYTLSKQQVLVVHGLYLLFRPLRDLGGSPVTGQRGPTT